MAIPNIPEPQHALKQLLRSRCLTFKWLARQSGYSPSTLYKVSSGHLLPSRRLQRKIEETLNVHPIDVWDPPIL